MIAKLIKRYRKSNIATKIRYSYLLILIPMILFIVFCVYSINEGNKRYDDMVEAAVAASEFSLDFKKDFDYETYLLIVGNKSIDESRLNEMLSDAERIVGELGKLSVSENNIKRLESASRYINNLKDYIGRVKENIGQEDKYEDNIRIWETDIQIVTMLLQETISEYIYYEIRDIQCVRDENRRFYEQVTKVSAVAFLGVAILLALLSYAIPQSITKPVRQLNEVTEQISKGNLDVRANIDAGGELNEFGDSLNTMIEKINELLQQVTTEQIRLRNAELELLQAQINPHFLYNTLDTIIWLAEGGDQKMVVSMVKSLSEFFRTSLNRGLEFISIKEELQHAKSYLEIQQVRYQDILEYEIKVPEELYPYTIPKITIQPLVENALYHGIKYKRDLGKISITGKKEGDYIFLYVKDNGIGMTQERLEQVNHAIQSKDAGSSEIYGVYNVNERIALKFGEEYGIHIDSAYMEGTSVCIILPAVL